MMILITFIPAIKLLIKQLLTINKIYCFIGIDMTFDISDSKFRAQFSVLHPCRKLMNTLPA